MNEWACYRLVPRSPFHLGERGVGLEETSVILHSDTLFSALCYAFSELNYDLHPLLDSFPRYKGGFLPGAAPFKISSAFPYATGVDENGAPRNVDFLPRPWVKIRVLNNTGDPRLGKTLKKIRFVSKSIFETLIAAEDLPADLYQVDPKHADQFLLDRDLFVQDGLLWLDRKEKMALQHLLEPSTGQLRLWTEFVQPRVTVDRVSNRSQVYNVGRVFYKQGVGLFFLVEYHDLRWKTVLEQALRFLGEAGVGGERSSGNGQFELEIENGFDLRQPADGSNAYATLSLYWPTQNEISGKALCNSAYLMQNRRGWLTSPEAMNLRRKSVRMITEGSVLSFLPRGALADVKPLDPSPAPNVTHDVWRYGLAFPVAVRLNPNQDDNV